MWNELRDEWDQHQVNIEATLKGLSRIAIDTAPLIYFVEQHPAYFEQMLLVMKQIDEGTITGMTSVITLTEVLVLPIRENKEALTTQYERVLSGSRNFLSCATQSRISTTCRQPSG